MKKKSYKMGTRRRMMSANRISRRSRVARKFNPVKMLRMGTKWRSKKVKKRWLR